MANPASHSHARSRRTLETEFTAQPRPLAEELEAVMGQESSLSLDPEDLGSHFLSEAIVQGDLIERDAAEFELALLEETELEDQPSSARDISEWTQLIDRAGADGDLLEQLQDAAEFGADALDAERRVEVDPELDLSVSLLESSIHEASLMDREGAEPEETITPDVETEDGGRHARTAHDVSQR